MRKEIPMDDPVFQAGTSKSANMAITIAPAGLNCSVEMYLTPDGVTKAATTGSVAFTSQGSQQSVALPIVMPVNGGYEYQVYVDIYVAGTLYGQYIASENVIVPSVGDPGITW